MSPKLELLIRNGISMTVIAKQLDAELAAAEQRGYVKGLERAVCIGEHCVTTSADCTHYIRQELAKAQAERKEPSNGPA